MRLLHIDSNCSYINQRFKNDIVDPDCQAFQDVELLEKYRLLDVILCTICNHLKNPKSPMFRRRLEPDKPKLFRRGFGLGKGAYFR